MLYIYKSLFIKKVTNGVVSKFSRFEVILPTPGIHTFSKYYGELYNIMVKNGPDI